MKDDLGFGDEIFGIGASIFFVSYALLEVPSNLLLQRIGARLTILRIMTCWGIVSTATMFVQTPQQFYVARLLLGAFEAGFFPGIIYYLTQWYPDQYRARIIGRFMTALVVAPLIAGPLSGWLLSRLDAELGLRGWQWMLLIEGVPSVLMGIVAYFTLSDAPRHANWLNEDEKQLLEDALNEKKQVATSRSGIVQVARDWRVYLLGLIFFLSLLGFYSLSFWLPSILKSLGIADFLMIGVYSIFPAMAGLVSMIVIGHSSDRSGERVLHYAISSCVGAVGLSLAAVLPQNPLLAIASLAVAYAGVAGSLPVFWSVPGAYLKKSTAAAGIALINTIGVTAGLVGPALMGFVKKETGQFALGLHICSLALIVGAAVMLFGTSGIAASRHRTKTVNKY